MLGLGFICSAYFALTLCQLSLSVLFLEIGLGLLFDIHQRFFDDFRVGGLKEISDIWVKGQASLVM